MLITVGPASFITSFSTGCVVIFMYLALPPSLLLSIG